MAECWLCLACEEEGDLVTCSECGRAVCHECCDWACDDEDDDCGDWVCDDCSPAQYLRRIGKGGIRDTGD
jgi:hypothetical protein